MKRPEKPSPRARGAAGGEPETLPVEAHLAAEPVVRRFRLTVVEGGPQGRTWESAGDRGSVGSHELNDLVLVDPTVSRFQAEVKLGPSGAVIRDLGSRNGTSVDGVRVLEAYLRNGSVVQMGRVALRFELASESNRLQISEHKSWGGMAGASIAMRASFALMERAAASDATVLLEGETGTGKSVAAHAIHAASARKSRPFIVVDCGAIPPNLLESELFGHEKGAFTGATSARAGVFEEANGGTVFLDEVGELGLELQPKLLRAIEERVIRRVGRNVAQPIDVRLVAATNRDLRQEVNAGRFRADLFFRLAVVRIAIPPLRQRPEDIPAIVDRILATLGAEGEDAAPLRTPEFRAGLARSAWPGNARELRNHIERCLVMHDALAPPLDGGASPSAFVVDPSIPYAEARRRVLDGFERAYVGALVAAHGGRVTQAASAAEMDRVYLHRLIRRHRVG